MIQHKPWLVYVATGIAAVVTILSLLGLLPWATKASLDSHADADSKMFSRIDEKLDQIHEDLLSMYQQRRADDGRH